MGTQGGADKQLPPPPGPTRAVAKPFGRWASENRTKLAVAVLGGLALNVANAWGVTLFRPDAPPDLPAKALVTINAATNVCWKVTLGLPHEPHEKEQGCGDAIHEVKALPKGALVYPPDTTFIASVHKTYRKRVTGRVTIVLLVRGEVVDRASTSLETASVRY